MKVSERAGFLSPLVLGALEEADARRDSLTLIRPREIRLEAKPKSNADLLAETEKHKDLAAQLSLLEEDEPVEPLVPCRMQFILHWTDQDRKAHRQECDDWETAAAFNRFDRMYGEAAAVANLREKYEQKYFDAGLFLGFSTHSRRNAENNSRNQWLLVGLIRLDETSQGSLL